MNKRIRNIGGIKYFPSLKNYSDNVVGLSKASTKVYPGIRKIGKEVTSCNEQVNAYADCCMTKSLNINQFDCEKEFKLLKDCMKAKK